MMNEDGVLYVAGDATDESNLLRAGAEGAKGLVAALATDADNVFLVLSARQLVPDLYIVARARQEGAKNRLQVAKADYRPLNSEIHNSSIMDCRHLEPLKFCI